MIHLSIDLMPFQGRLRQLAVDIERLPDRFHNAMQGRKGNYANQALSQITQEPGPPIYPIRWKTQRQRRAFFATDGFGKGIPTRRDGTLLRGWRVIYDRTADGGVLRLVNLVGYMRFVQGSDPQPFHLDTGWVQRRDVEDDFLREAGDTVIETWQKVGDQVIGGAR